MKKAAKRKLIGFALAAALGFLLHFLYGWLPNPVFAVFSPVRESLWEHVKIVFWPLCAAGLFLSGRDGRMRSAWLLAAAAVSLGMLAAAYLCHVVLEGSAMAFDIGLFLVSVAAGFLLPGPLSALTGRPAVRWAVLVAAVAMAAALFTFTFRPPDGILFADLSGGVNTFLTIPV